MFHLNQDQTTLPVMHLGCPCRPWILACGVFVPKPPMEPVDVEVPEQPDVRYCEDCRRMWNAIGCGICKCKGNKICSTCTAGKHAAI